MRSTTKALREPTVVELEEQTPKGQRELAAARLELRAASLLTLALEASGISQSELADELGVTQGRVSQVLCGDGNLRLSTVARYLRAMGYIPKLDAQPESDQLPAIGLPKRRRDKDEHKDEVAVYVGLAANGASTHPIVTMIPREFSLDGVKIVEQRLAGTVGSHSVRTLNSSLNNYLSSAVNG